MRHFPFPIHAAVVGVTVVAGLASYQGVDKLVLAKGGSQYGTPGAPGHEPPSTTSTTAKEPGKSTSTTTHDGPTWPSTTSTLPDTPESTTSTTVYHEPGSTPPTTTHKEPGPWTSTTLYPEPTPSTTVPASPPAPPTVEVLTLRCGTVARGGIAGASCAWTQVTAPDFAMYVVTRELAGTPRQTVFTSQNPTDNHFGDTTLTVGDQYSYIVEAFDAGGNVIGRSAPLLVNCCDGTIVST